MNSKRTMSRDEILSLAAIIAAMLVVNMIYAVSLPLLSLTLSQEGVSEGIIGLNTAAQPLAAFIIAPFLPRLIARFRPSGVMTVALLTFGVVMILLPLKVDLAYWFALRPFLGMAGCALWVASEAWINTLARDESRGRVIGIYSTASAFGWMLGPVILLVLGSEGYLPYMVSAAIAFSAILPMVLAKGNDPDLSSDKQTRIWMFLLLAPLPLLINFVVATTHESFSTFFALFAVAQGNHESTAFSLMATTGFGALITQYPIGLLADRMNRVVLTIGLILVNIACAAAFSSFVDLSLPSLFLFFVWGAAGGGLYSLAIILLGQRFKGGELAGASAAFTGMYSVGILAGPPVTGAVMEWVGPAGLTYTLVTTLALMLPVALWRLLVSDRPTASDQS